MVSFSVFANKHDSPTRCTPAKQSALAEYRDRIPADLLSFWREHGWCGWGHGLLWVVNPSDFIDVLRDWVLDPSGKYVIARTAFGSMFVWDGTEVQFIDVVTGDVSPLYGGMVPLFDGVLSDDSYLEHVVRKRVFDEALPRIGEPAPDEVYAFVPALSLGGSGTSDTVQIVKLREHLHLLSQMR